MGRPAYWTKARVIAALQTGQPVSWSVVMRYWRTLNAARAEAGVLSPRQHRQAARQSPLPPGAEEPGA